MLVAILPPGAFFGLAALLALRTWSIDRRAQRVSEVPVPGAGAV
jgi:Na+-translocating ferredoxin:NAD+ oxidoreductase RnfE subunit